MVSPDAITVGRRFTFEAAHCLPNHSGKCCALHGHTYTVIVEVTGLPDPDTGMVVDFYDLKRTVNQILETLDHSNLNDCFPTRLTTVEFLARWFTDKLFTLHMADRAEEAIQGVSVQIQEGEGGYARWQRQR